jgi:DNA mismatch repair protein MutS
VTNFVSEVDFYKSAAKSAIKNHYTKPEIGNGDQSYIHAIKMRHPLVEALNKNSTYIPSDINLNYNVSKVDPKTGYLIYSPNAGGKSCLMKAVGVNLVLAQAGLYVAADRWLYNPYHSILTRILGNDNIFKGLSSFAVEMTELRGILSRANSRSLVLGDEVCHGTETVSGVAIVASTLIELMKCEAHFIFASHLHQLTELEEIKALDKLAIYHLHVEFDEKRHVLTYHRDLRPGSGSSLYGLEVARGMDMPDEFLGQANKIRQKIIGESEELLSTRKSRYNNELYMDKCGICGLDGEDTHHLKMQCTADKDGFIGSMHKDHVRNLIVLCKKCHIETHQGKYDIRGYRVTTEGVTLDYVKEVKEVREVKEVKEVKQEVNKKLSIKLKMNDKISNKICK